MRRYFFVTALSLLVASLSANDLLDIRRSFYQAVLEKSEIKPFYDLVYTFEEPDATIMAYQAVAKAMYAQLEWNPLTKFENVRIYDKIMEEAVDMDPENVEILFLRMSVEFHLPRFLGYSDHLDADHKKILKQLSDVEEINYDPTFSKFIYYFLQDTGLYTQDEMDRIRKRLEGL